MQAVLAITKALADPGRLRILCALKASRELCACQIDQLLQLAPSTVSRHLAILTQAGLVDSRKDGKWVHFRLADDPPPAAVEALQWVERHCACQPAVEQDTATLSQILTTTPEVPCQLPPPPAPASRSSSSAPATPAAAKWWRATRVRSKAT